MNDPHSSDKWGSLTDEKPKTTYPVITQPILATLLGKGILPLTVVFFLNLHGKSAVL